MGSGLGSPTRSPPPPPWPPALGLEEITVFQHHPEEFLPSSGSPPALLPESHPSAVPQPPSCCRVGSVPRASAGLARSNHCPLPCSILAWEGEGPAPALPSLAGLPVTAPSVQGMRWSSPAVINRAGGAGTCGRSTRGSGVGHGQGVGLQQQRLGVGQPRQEGDSTEQGSAILLWGDASAAPRMMEGRPHTAATEHQHFIAGQTSTTLPTAHGVLRIPSLPAPCAHPRR